MMKHNIQKLIFKLKVVHAGKMCQNQFLTMTRSLPQARLARSPLTNTIKFCATRIFVLNSLRRLCYPNEHFPRNNQSSLGLEYVLQFLCRQSCYYTKLCMRSIGDVENAGKVKDLIMTKVGILLLK